jgi:SAM-dependent MidA family methyltransferase
MPPALPDPGPAALAHSARVGARIAAEIGARGGWIPFSRYMELALHAPGLGYYAAGANKFGVEGDFVTAPEMTPLFGATLAVQVAELLGESGGEVLELGAGTGRLAVDLLRELVRLGEQPSRYAILEPSPELRARQQARVERELGPLAGGVAWVNSLPRSLTGVVVANEVLDAIPCEMLRREQGTVLRRGVGVDDDAGGAGPPMFRWIDRALVPDDPLAVIARERLADVEGYVSEVNPAAEALVRTLASRLDGGSMLLIDYGFPGAEYYHPQRSQGTLMCHYRHRAHGDPLIWPGLQDITAHVDFSAIAHAAVDGGARVAGYASLAGVLLELGIAERLRALAEPGSAEYVRASAPVQKLLGPNEMGELFKVLGVARGDERPWTCFRRGDRTGRL